MITGGLQEYLFICEMLMFMDLHSWFPPPPPYRLVVYIDRVQEERLPRPMRLNLNGGR